MREAGLLWEAQAQQSAGQHSRNPAPFRGLLTDRAPAGSPEAKEDHAAVMRLWVRRRSMLEGLRPAGTVAAARKELAEQLFSDLCRLDHQMKELRQRLAEVVAASAGVPLVADTPAGTESGCDVNAGTRPRPS